MAKLAVTYGLLVVAVVLVIVTEKSGVLSTPEILLETALGLGVNVALTAEHREKNGEKNERVSGSP
jgi:hypothetical protein